MRIRIGSNFEDWTPEKLASERKRKAEASARYTPDFDEGWLSIWASNATHQLHHLIEDVLEEPEMVVDEPHHCKQTLREIHGQYGTFYCCRICDFKGGYNTIHRGRKRKEVEWVKQSYKKAIDMNINGCYFITRETNEPLNITAGQMGLG